eukprot:m.72804 g.72804  ORF g.72804 m.72804 type:complete len:268 (-) comp12343_c0_seq1:545-1348(-)
MCTKLANGEEACYGSSCKMAAETQTFVVKYRGFVHVDKATDGVPEMGAVKEAAKLLKGNQKVARQLHPLFARGLDTELDLQVTESGLVVTIPTKTSEQGPVVLHQPIHKIVLVVDVGTCTCFLVKRPGVNKFKCHSFDCGTSKKAHELAQHTADVSRSAFKRVRQSVRRIKRASQDKLVDKAGIPTGGADADVQAANSLAARDIEAVKQLVQAVNIGTRHFIAVCIILISLMHGAMMWLPSNLSHTLPCTLTQMYAQVSSVFLQRLC